MAGCLAVWLAGWLDGWLADWLTSWPDGDTDDEEDADGDGGGLPSLSLRVQEDPNFGWARQIISWRDHARNGKSLILLYFKW